MAVDGKAVAGDEDALSWAGETDPTHVASSARDKAASKSAAKSDAKSASKSNDEPGADDQRKPMHPAVLIAFGIFAGVYLLYAVGWVIFGYAYSPSVQGVFFAIMYEVGVALAIASPFLWAAAVWLRVKRPTWRMLWLVIGVIVLAPWPFIIGGLG
jgi:hypothetical protein